MAPVSHPFSVCPVLELPEGMLPLLAMIPTVRRELACLILSISYTGKERGSGKGYIDENPSCRPEQGCAAALHFHFCLASFPPGP